MSEVEESSYEELRIPEIKVRYQGGSTLQWGPDSISEEASQTLEDTGIDKDNPEYERFLEIATKSIQEVLATMLQGAIEIVYTDDGVERKLSYETRPRDDYY